jgi:CheY-like chemotaxis protein
MEDSASFFLHQGAEYVIECYHCREPFNVAEAVSCNCLTPQRTFICPRCLNCFCGAPKSYIEKFWEQAPQDVWDRVSRERDLHSVAPVNPLPYQAKHPLVLVVEPDRHIQHMARRIIEDLGYGVVVASDGQTGLQMAEAYQPDFVLTAALMPNLDGREMCRLLKESPKTKNIKVAVMTSLYTQQKYRSEAFRRFHVDEYVSKPLKMNDLQNLLRKYLDQSA